MAEKILGYISKIRFFANVGQGGRTGRHYFKGPFQLPLGVQQVQRSRMTFKSQRYRERCQSNQKLLHHYQHSKNQLNS